MDELLAADEPRLAEQLDEHLEDVALYAEYRRLVAEHAALRLLATLVARGVEPSEVFDAVTKEMCRCVPAEGAGLWRYETSDEITMVAAAYHSAAESMKWPVALEHRPRATPSHRWCSAPADPLGWTPTS